MFIKRKQGGGVVQNPYWAFGVVEVTNKQSEYGKWYSVTSRDRKYDWCYVTKLLC
jgi:hypothetical protein